MDFPHLPAQTNRAPQPRRPLPGGSPLTLKAFSYVRKSVAQAAWRGGHAWAPTATPGLAVPVTTELQAGYSQGGACGIPAGPLCRSQPISYHGHVLLSSSHLLPYRHLELG